MQRVSAAAYGTSLFRFLEIACPRSANYCLCAFVQAGRYRDSTTPLEKTGAPQPGKMVRQAGRELTTCRPGLSTRSRCRLKTIAGSYLWLIFFAPPSFHSYSQARPLTARRNLRIRQLAGQSKYFLRMRERFSKGRGVPARLHEETGSLARAHLVSTCCQETVGWRMIKS